MATPSAEKLLASILLGWGSTQGSEEVLLNFEESTSTTGNRRLKIPIELAAGATDTQLNLNTYVDTATWIAVVDRSTIGFKVGYATANKSTVASDGVWLFKNGAATPPTLYLDNVSGADKCFLEVIVLGASS